MFFSHVNARAALATRLTHAVPLIVLPSWAQIGVGVVQPIGGTNTISAVQPTPSPGGVADNIVTAWNGGALAFIDGKLYLLVHGGGHGDYAGNEVVRFGPLDSNNPQWSLFGAATPSGQVTNGAAYNADGKPNISHTRSTLAVLGGKLWKTPQAGVYSNATSYPDLDAFVLATAAWDPAGTYADSSFGSGIRGALLADSVRNKLWYVSDQISRLYDYNPSSNAWTQYTPTVVTGNTVVAAISPSRDEIYASFGSQNLLYSLASPNSAPDTTGFTGTPPSDSAGLAWDAGRARYVALNTDTARNIVRELDPTTKIWTQRTFTGTHEAAPEDANGIYGRFQYVSALQGYLYVGRAGGSVYFYRSH